MPSLRSLLCKAPVLGSLLMISYRVQHFRQELWVTPKDIAGLLVFLDKYILELGCSLVGSLLFIMSTKACESGLASDGEST